MVRGLAKFLSKITVIVVSLLAVAVSMRMSDDARARKMAVRRVSEPDDNNGGGQTNAPEEANSDANDVPRGVDSGDRNRNDGDRPRQPIVACISSSWQWESLQRVADAFAAHNPEVELIVERSRDPAERMEELARTRGVRCFLSGTSESHVRKILPWLRAHPEVLVCSPTSTALPDSFEGGLLPPNFVRVMPHDGNMPNVIGKCCVNEVRERIKASRKRAAKVPSTVPEPSPETKHLFEKPQLERIAASGLLVDPTEQQPEVAPPKDPLAALHTVAVVYMDTAYGQGLAKVLRAQLPAMNLGLAVRYVPFAPGADMQATVDLLEAMAEPERLDVVVYLGFGGDFNGYVRACRSAPRVQALNHILGPGVAFDQDLLRNSDAPRLMENAYALVYFGEPGSARRYRQLAAKMGTGGANQVVGPSSALQHDALSLLSSAERAGGGHEELRRAAATFSGVTGQIRLDSRGDRVGGAYNLVGIQRTLGALAWKVVGVRSVVGTAEVRLKRQGGGVHTLIGSKLNFTRKALPVQKVLRAAGMSMCGSGGNDGSCTCKAEDKVRIRSTDLYGNQRTWQGDLANMRQLAVHAADRTHVQVGCSLQPAFSVRVMPITDDRDPSPVFMVPDHTQSSSDVQEVVVL